MTASQSLFTHLVSAGMSRAHWAAAYAERHHPGWRVEPAVVTGSELDDADPAVLPDVRFILSDDAGECDDVRVSLHATGQRMYAAIAKTIVEAEAVAQQELTHA